MLVTQKRPRNLDWRHAGALLFGDWGTSRLYVLGLAFFYTAHATPLFLLAMSVLMAGVAWAYTIICRNFPDGGGVYASARRIHPLLGLVGATLLFCGYIITASLSVVEAMHYFGVRHEWVAGGSIAVIGVVGVVNWFGSKSAGRLALVIAVAALVVSVSVAAVCLRFVPEGLRSTTLGHPSVSSGGERWMALVHIVLALSGVEVVANMTGVMKEPVRRTAKRTIWPVLAEVVVLNLLFGLALAGLPRFAEVSQPDAVTYREAAAAAGPSAPPAAEHTARDPVPADVREYRDTALKTLARAGGTRTAGETAGRWFAAVVGVVCALLLISAGNTAIMGMVGVQYAMGQDRELPRISTRLNYSGVPWLPLVVACIAPAAVLLVVSDTPRLADLYAVGVCGAITTNVLAVALGRGLDVGRGERAGLLLVGVVMLAIEATILVTKPHATLFVGSVVGAVLVTRFVVRAARRAPEAASLEPAHGWIAEALREPPPIDMSRPRIMLAARGRSQSEYAVAVARARGATLFTIYVRTLRVMDAGATASPRLEDDRQAQEALGTTMMLAREAGVACVPLYVCSTDIADEILDYTVTYGCDTLIMGKTRRRAFARAVEGDVVTRVAAHLPEGVTLELREATRADAGQG